MENLIDLDEAAKLISHRAIAWHAAGIEVGPTTWRDQANGWPPEIKTNRDEVGDPDSVGVQLRSGAAEAEIVLFKGAWVDFAFWSGHPSDEAILDPGHKAPLDLPMFVAILDRMSMFFQSTQRNS